MLVLGLSGGTNNGKAESFFSGQNIGAGYFVKKPWYIETIGIAC
jgi:hypothetical protein